MSRRAEAIALGISGALHGAVLCAGLASDWPSHARMAIVPVELVAAEPESVSPPPVARHTPPRIIERPAVASRVEFRLKADPEPGGC